MINRRNRIRKNSEYQEVFDSKKILSSSSFRLHFDFPADESEAKLGVVVSKKVSNKASKRNKLKRRIKAITLQHQIWQEGSLRLVVIAKPGSETLKFEQIEEEISGLLDKIKLK
ncbi:MAG: ribonuclease P protein component [Candidatus Dojkabacteria bacterium]